MNKINLLSQSELTFLTNPQIVCPKPHRSFTAKHWILSKWLKVFSCLIMLLLGSNVKAQKVVLITENNEQTTTLFEYGQAPTTTEANFKNLFENFPLLVSNSGKGLKLISYKFLTAIKSGRQIKFFVKKNTKIYRSGGGITAILGANDIENNRIRLVFPSGSRVDKRIEEALLKEERDAVEKVIENINIGDEVYVVKLVADGTAYNLYLFVNPITNKVLKEGSFLGFSIPLYYADFYSKRNIK